VASARGLKAVLGSIPEHLDAALTPRDLAAVAHLSLRHLARRLQDSTEQPPHQQFIAQPIERAERGQIAPRPIPADPGTGP
jgi:AraC-like DNA-binding protein